MRVPLACQESHFSMQSRRSRLFSSFIVLGAGSLYVVLSMILQMFSMGLRSGEFAGQPSLAIKFGRFF